MGWGRGIETEIIPNRGGDYTELGGSKWKAGKGFLKPNFELGPNWVNRPRVRLALSLTRARVQFQGQLSISIVEHRRQEGGSDILIRVLVLGL